LCADLGGDKAMQTVTSFNPRQLHRYRFEGEPSVTFSLKELKVTFVLNLERVKRAQGASPP